MNVKSRFIEELSKTKKRYKEREEYHKRVKELKGKGKYIDTHQALCRLEYKGYDRNQILFTDKITRERTLGTDDLLNINYLKKGVIAAGPVGRITINAEEGRGYGTGFIISENLIMTNNHVLPTKEYARDCYIEFNYEEDENSQPENAVAFGFQPNTFFITSPELDFTIVAVGDCFYGKQNKLSDFGALKLIENIGKLQIGEKVSIIQHPNGERKQVALRNNEVIDIFDHYIHYETDTEPGSSGSPVFNEDWEVVALHHSGVPDTDGNGKVMNKKGKVWNEEQEREHEIRWVANEGIRISSIIKHLRLKASEKQKLFLHQILEEDSPLIVSGTAPTLGTDTGYYNYTEDGLIIKHYYEEIDFERKPDDLFRDLNKLLVNTHKNKLPYRPSKYVYPEVDLHEDGKLRSIYSGKEFTGEELIMADERVDLARKSRLLEFHRRNELILLEEYSTMIEEIEYSLPYNCEHVVPQSWFDKRNPMRGDLHHLFACESRCNGFRGNYSYFDFKDYEPEQPTEIVKHDCGKREDNKFEPQINKGIVARATLYYLLRYPGMIEKNYNKNGVAVLMDWHERNPVSLYERHRNYKIYQMQGNRNPLIDIPDLVGKVNFENGI